MIVTEWLDVSEHSQACGTTIILVLVPLMLQVSVHLCIREFLMYSSEYRYGTEFSYLVVKSLYGFGTSEKYGKVPAEQHSLIA